MQDLIQKNAKALVALVVAAIVAYFTPEQIADLGAQAGELVSAGVVAALTALVVWLVPNKR